MYNNSIDASNRIITADDLLEIFSKMNDKLKYYIDIYKKEASINEKLEYEYQKWSFKDSSSYLNFVVRFNDKTEIKFENYSSFLVAFNSRINEIKEIICHFNLSYSKCDESRNWKYYTQKINMYCYEDRLEIDFSLSEEDRIIDDLYSLISTKINNAPSRYDRIIKKKNSIEFVTGFVPSFILFFILTTVSLLFEPIRKVLLESVILYPIICIVLSALFSGFFSSMLLSKYYQNIVPEKKYAGYDVENHRSIYKDDIDKFTSDCEILIGKNTNNMKCRQNIEETYNKYRKFIPIELTVLVICSLVVMVISMFVK